MNILKIYFILFFILLISCSNSKGTVNSVAGLVLRTNPNVGSERIDLIPNGAEVTIIDKNGPSQTIYGITANWYEVKYNGKRGWAFGGLITLSKDQNIATKSDSSEIIQENRQGQEKEGNIPKQDIKLVLCQEEAVKLHVGKESLVYNPDRGAMIPIIRESLQIKCEYGVLYLQTNVFDRTNGTREEMQWTPNEDVVVCPGTVRNLGSICK